jgi:hypothetical protein
MEDHSRIPPTLNHPAHPVKYAIPPADVASTKTAKSINKSLEHNSHNDLPAVRIFIAQVPKADCVCPSALLPLHLSARVQRF